MDQHSKSIQSTQTTRKCNYDDALYCYDKLPPESLPDWTYISEKEEKESKKGKKVVKGKGKEAEKTSRRRKITDYEESIMYTEDEKHHTGESARIGEIQGQ